jgi:diacylglycerol kinase (ATP)|tara:strand:+ start:214 stop:390 length:177 start_codon:yes stop_codon:yes gene_type:complete
LLLPVLIIELINSGSKHVVDRMGLEHQPLSGQANDAGSAAVFIGNINEHQHLAFNLSQ